MRHILTLPVFIFSVPLLLSHIRLAYLGGTINGRLPARRDENLRQILIAKKAQGEFARCRPRIASVKCCSVYLGRPLEIGRNSPQIFEIKHR
jgi:hypothetical protein